MRAAPRCGPIGIFEIWRTGKGFRLGPPAGLIGEHPGKLADRAVHIQHGQLNRLALDLYGRVYHLRLLAAALERQTIAYLVSDARHRVLTPKIIRPTMTMRSRIKSFLNIRPTPEPDIQHGIMGQTP